jgi:energy-coupling factor transporter ATP-binding protein EcfA2
MEGVTIIAFNGKKGSGKTTTAEALKKLINSKLEDQPEITEVVILAFADKVKSVAKALVGIPQHRPFPKDKKFPNFYTGEGGTITGRQLLQWIGTEVFRTHNRSVWVDSLEATIADIRDQGTQCPVIVIIDDLRFNNEADWVRSNKGKVINLIGRQEAGIDNHASERAVDHDKINYVLETSMQTPEQVAQIIFDKLTRIEFLCI